jgi:acetyl esterase/lipase
LAIFLTIIIVVTVLWLVGWHFLQGSSHDEYDQPEHSATGSRSEPSDEHHSVVERLTRSAKSLTHLSQNKRVHGMRKQVSQLGTASAQASDVSIEPTDAGGVPAEWVIAPGATTERRLLYIHGGGYTAGSPASHRAITAKFSAASQSAVLAIDYRKMPEHPRMAGIEDCRIAYQWILEHGPEGAHEAQSIVVAGDSAGGNLALTTIAWARDAGIRPADAAVALSPTTDATLASPSLLENMGSDQMLGPVLGPMTKLPRVISAWLHVLSHRIRPSNPIVSPLHGDLANLPPTLIHASEAEMLLDDAVRYVNKAIAAGSRAKLQTWPFMLHAWHGFEMPEADEAFARIQEFLAEETQ